MQKLKVKIFFSKGCFQKNFLNSYELSQKQILKNSVLVHSFFPSKAIEKMGEKKNEREESVFFNYPFDKGRLKNIVCWFFEKHGQYKTLKFLEKLKEVGFGSATNAGISLGIDDLKIPNQKIGLVSKAETKVLKDFLQYRNAQITGIERIQRFIYTWNQTNDTLKQEVVRLFETTDLLNPIYMMAFSGARGNMSQVRQLVGMRGLMSDPQGQIIDFPIMSNFREGLTLTEYLISTYGARKGIVDTALRTATAGYLTRRLVDVAQHTIVSKFDCGTMRGIFLFDMKDGKKTIYSFQNRLIGRVLAQNIEFFDSNILSPSKGTNAKSEIQYEKEKKQRAFRNQEIDSKLAQVLSRVTKKAFVRSPLTCETSRFVCQLCYGWSFSHGKLVSVGEAVGIIAAQSIGEPGTQLTMRTFHTGGVFAGGLTDQILAPFDGKIKYFKNIPGTCVRNPLSEIAFFTKMPGSFLVEKETEKKFFFDEKTFEKKKKGKKGEIFRIPAYAVLFCRNNEFVKKKQVLAQFSSVLKKMQYGRAEQTLYSTSAGEFVFGKSFFFDGNDSFGDHSKTKKKKESFENLNTIGKQTLLLEKRKSGDFSEVELRNDILWKSQNWTTVWILSGNIFSHFFHKNFIFREGDFFKKTSVLQRVLWKKKKNYKYSLFASQKIQKKFLKNAQYLFAVEKKFMNSSHFFPFEKNEVDQSFSLKEKNVDLFFKKENFLFSSNLATVCLKHPEKNHRKILSLNFFNFEKNFFMKKNVQTHFSLFSFDPFEENTFFKTKKIFFFCTSSFSHFFLTKKNSLNIEKKSDFAFLCSADQYKSNRVLSDFEKIMYQSHFYSEKKETKKQKKIGPHFSRRKKSGKNLFFQFLQKRKNAGIPFFLNISTFSKIYENSQKFGIFSSFLFSKSPFSTYQNPFSFIHLPQKKNSFFFFYTNILYNSIRKKTKEFQFSENQPSLSKSNKKVFSVFFSKEKKRLETSFFSRCVPKKIHQNTKGKTLFLFSDKKKKFSHVYPLSNEKNTKNIFLKKTLFKFPLSQMYYKNFGYFSLFYTFEKNQKLKNSFLTFSSFREKHDQRNIGKRENFFSFGDGNENFFGKETPSKLSSCFFSNSQTKNGGIFYSSLFEQNSKKKRLSSFLCENFSFSEENKNPSSITEFFFKNQISKVQPDTRLDQKDLVLSGQNLLYSTFLKNRNENSKKLKKTFLSPTVSLFLFQMPTFSFLSFYKHVFENAFYQPVNLLFETKKQKNFFNSPSHFGNGNGETKRRNLKTSKIQFFDFHKQPFTFLRNENGQFEKKKYFFFSHFCLNQSNTYKENSVFFKNADENKKGKNENFDLYEKEISWLPQENLLISISDIVKDNSVKEMVDNFYSCIHQKPFLFFVNRQGKKKVFSWNGGTVFSKIIPSRRKNGIEGFVKISNCKTFLPETLTVQNKKQKSEKKSSLQKLSFFSLSLKKKKSKYKQISNFQKSIAFQFQKRKENKKLKKSLKLFLKKDFRSFSFLNSSRNNIFFAKKLKTQCFTCLPFKKNSLFKEQNKKVSSDSIFPSSLPKANMFLQKKKLRFTIEQGWPVFPFFSSKECLLKTKKGIEKKGHFYGGVKSSQNGKNILFEQNDTFFETVLFPKKRETFVYEIHSLYRNKKCRFFSFDDSSFQFSEKKLAFGFFSSKKKNENQKPEFENCVSPFHINSQKSNFSVQIYDTKKATHFSNCPGSCKLLASAEKQMEKKNIVQLFRFFQYTILENPKNVENFLFNGGVQFFSKMYSSSCFLLYKNYHSPLFNQQKKEKYFFLENVEKNQNTNFQILSNFEEISSSLSISPFFSFSQQNGKLHFKKKFCKNFKLKVEKKENQFDFTSIFPNKKQQIDFPIFAEEHKKKIGLFWPKTTDSFSSEKNGEDKKFFFHFQKNKEKKNFSYYPVQFQPLFLSVKTNDFSTHTSFFSKKRDSAFFEYKRKSKKFENSFFPTFSMNALQNTIEFHLCEKRGTFFDERFSFGNLFDFVETSSFWFNKDSMNFLISPLNIPKKSIQILSSSQAENKKNTKIYKNTIFDKNIHYYGSTDFLSLYDGELLPLLTHEMYWWKKASEISTLQKIEKLFTIISKKDLVSLSFSFSEEIPLAINKIQNQKNESSFLKNNFSNSLKGKQKHLEKLSQVLSKMYTKTHFVNSLSSIEKNSNSFLFLSPNEKKKFDQQTFYPSEKTKISSFLTKYENKIYTFQNLTVGYSSVFKKPFLGSFVVYGDNFFGSAIQKPGQIIHLSFSSMTLRRGQPCFVSSNGIFHFYTSPYVEKNVPLVTLPYQTVQAGDIVQGIPKVEQLFEARTTLQGRLFVSSLPILLKGIFERYKVLLPLEQATRQSFLKIQQIIVDGVQRVYRSQGVSITDKHLEVVVRQMTTKVQILHGAQTGFFPGELVSLDFVERINQFLMVKIRYEPVILGITRASLEVESFLSASSFQQTTKILSLAAISRKKDFLKGLKENLLVGNLIPSGTGFFHLSKKM